MPAGLQDRQVPFEVRPLVRERLFERIANPGLRGEVDNSLRRRLPDQGGHGLMLCDIQLDHAEASLSAKALGARAFQRGIIVGIEGIDP